MPKHDPDAFDPTHHLISDRDLTALAMHMERAELVLRATMPANDATPATPSAPTTRSPRAA